MTNSCPNCGASISKRDFVCDYCGSSIESNVKQVDETTSPDDYMKIINNNLDALNSLRRPPVFPNHGHEEKPKFDPSSYKKISSTIRRNIKMLEVSAKGDKTLLAQLQVLKEEYYKITDDFKQQLYYRKVLISSLIGLGIISLSILIIIMSLGFDRHLPEALGYFLLIVGFGSIGLGVFSIYKHLNN